jgi:hypothetical protein
VPPGHWAARAIGKVVEWKLMPVASGNRFQPDQPVTRAELAAILVRTIDYLESRGPVKLSTSPAKPDPRPEPLAALARFDPSHAAYRDLERLVRGGYLIPDAEARAFLPTPENVDRPVTATEVATAMAGMMLRITEKRTALEHPETLQEGVRPETQIR